MSLTQARGEIIGSREGYDEGASMKSPGAPLEFKSEDAKRNSSKRGSNVAIYSDGQRNWRKRKIINTFKDNECDWLVIKHAEFFIKKQIISNLYDLYSQSKLPVELTISVKRSTRQRKIHLNINLIKRFLDRFMLLACKIAV